MAKRDVFMKDIHVKCMEPEDTDKKCDLLSTGECNRLMLYILSILKIVKVCVRTNP